MVDALTMLKMLLPGTVITQAGEELGLSSLDLYMAENSTVKQHLALYRLLAEKVREQDAILFGELGRNSTFVRNNGSVFGLTRVKKGSPGYLLVINLTDKDVNLDLCDVHTVPEFLRVLESNEVVAVSRSEEEKRKSFPCHDVTLSQGQAKIFTYVPEFSE